MKSLKIAAGSLLMLVAMLFMGCSQRPFQAPKFVVVGTNETAFVIPLTGKTSDQATTMSEEYLKANQVLTKQIEIPTHWVQTGKSDGDGQYMDDVRVIKVDRTPVSVTWLSTKEGGSQATAVGVESAESIGFTVGVSLTARVEENDAARFLFLYAGKPLIDVVNSDVNQYVKGRFSAYFAVLPLAQGKLDKQKIIEKVFSETAAFFKPQGVTVTQLSQTSGLVYDNDGIQKTIDALATKQNEVALAELERQRVEKDNTTRKSVADTAKYERERASEGFAQNQAASVAQLQLEIERIKANAFFEWAKNGGKLPDVVPENVFSHSDFSKFFGMTPAK